MAQCVATLGQTTNDVLMMRVRSSILFRRSLGCRVREARCISIVVPKKMSLDFFSYATVDIFSLLSHISGQCQ